MFAMPDTWRVMRCSILAALVVAWLDPQAGFCRAGDWPGFLGPCGNGISAETGLLDHWPEGGPPVLWKKKVGEGYSAPSVLGDRLVFFHRLGDEEVVECLNPTTGKTLWRFADPTQFADP